MRGLPILKGDSQPFYPHFCNSSKVFADIINRNEYEIFSVNHLYLSKGNGNSTKHNLFYIF